MSDHPRRRIKLGLVDQLRIDTKELENLEPFFELVMEDPTTDNDEIAQIISEYHIGKILVTFTVADRKYRLNRKKFTNNAKEFLAEHPEDDDFILDNVKPEVFQLMVDYLNERANPDTMASRLPELFVLAETLKIRSLKECCESLCLTLLTDKVEARKYQRLARQCNAQCLLAEIEAILNE